jgi:hypothetical protein
VDDDVQFVDGDIDRLFSIVQQHTWDMAQASLSVDSSCSFPVFINPGKPGWRLVNGVELMMPIYSRRLLEVVKGLVGESISGWGFDAALSVVAQQQGMSAAVVDDIVAGHTRLINADIAGITRCSTRPRFTLKLNSPIFKRIRVHETIIFMKYDPPAGIGPAVIIGTIRLYNRHLNRS